MTDLEAVLAAYVERWHAAPRKRAVLRDARNTLCPDDYRALLGRIYR